MNRAGFPFNCLLWGGSALAYGVMSAWSLAVRHDVVQSCSLAVLCALTAVVLVILLRRRARQMPVARPHFGQAADEERYLA